MRRTEEKFAELNQPKLWSGVNAYRLDPMLVDLTSRFPRAVREELEALGRHVTAPEVQDLARMANESAPKLRTHGPRGERIDVVEFHPAWHALMRRSMANGLHCSVWENQPDPELKNNAHRIRAARFFLTAQAESGHLCPLTMTSASVAALMAAPAVQKEWAPKILSRNYDSANRPVSQKSAVTLGMGMTEKQGGTDVRANTSTAERVGEGIYRLAGHKWFLSAPMSDGFVMLARTREGMGCFLVPRLLEDGSTNGVRIQRLKDKIGNRSNASAEVEFSDAFGFLLGAPDAGIRRSSGTLLRSGAAALWRPPYLQASSARFTTWLIPASEYLSLVGLPRFEVPLISSPAPRRIASSMRGSSAGFLSHMFWPLATSAKRSLPMIA